LFPSDFKIQYYKDVDEYADRLRKLWDIGLDAISDFSTLLEEKGIRVFIINENADKNFDGLAAIVNKSPIIVLSKDLPGDRQRFTLAHELGHLLFDGKIGHGLDEEKVCNRFAGAFLLPSVAIKKALGDKRKNIEIAELGLIKSEYGASMQSAIMRANQAGVISYDYSSSLWKIFKKNGWLVTEPGEQYPSEKIYTFKHLVLRALAKNYISESKAAEFLNMSVNKFHKYRMENKV
jgi:Zn-dependent peptidase ImmA (M78 family)